MTQASKESFSKVSGDLANLLYSKSDTHAINVLLDELNAIDYRQELFLNLKEISSIISAICLNINASESFTAAKAAHFLNKLTQHQNISIDKQLYDRILWWDIDIIKACSELVVIDILQNIYHTLQQHYLIDIRLRDALLGKDGILINFLRNPLKVNSKFSLQNDVQSYVNLLVVKCMQSLTKHIDNDENSDDNLLLQPICDVLVHLIYKGQLAGCNDYNYVKTMTSALRTLCQVYINNYHSVDVKLDEVMGVAKYFMSYGLVPKTAITKVAPSQQTSAELPLPVIRRKPEGKKVKKRKPKINAIENLKKDCNTNGQKYEGEAGRNYQVFQVDVPEISPMIPRSESDVSEAENDAGVEILSARLRQHALTFLLVLVKETDKRQMFGYWSTLLPSSSDGSTRSSLADVVLRDPSPHVRHAALSVLLALLAGAKPYLHFAEYSQRETAFTPFSVSLGRTCVCAHEIICRAITHATHAASATLALRCACAALTALPYHRLQGGLLQPMIKAVRRFLIHKDTNLQVVALSVIGCLVSIDPPLPDILVCISKEKESKMTDNTKKMTVELRSKGDDDLSDFEELYDDDDDLFVISDKVAEDEVSCWVFELCLRNLGYACKGEDLVKCIPSTVPVMLESLQVLSALSTFHFSTVIRGKIGLLTKMLEDIFRSCHPQVDLRAIGFCTALGDAILKSEQEPNGAVPLPIALNFWKSLLDGPLPNLPEVQDNIPALCDAFAVIGERLYAALPRHHQILIISLLLGWCMEAEVKPDTNVGDHDKLGNDIGVVGYRRGAAVRALGHLVLYKQLREDYCFVSDCGECAVRVMEDPTLSARSKSSWTIASISDALLLNRNDEDCEEVEIDFVLKLLEASIKYYRDNDKVKTNLVRSIGNLLRLITAVENLSQPRVTSVVQQAMKALISGAFSANNMKVRWNACYALGNALSNDCIYNLTDLKDEALFTLSNLMIDCKNIKVRIKATAAIRTIRRTEDAKDVVRGFSSVAKAMESALNLHHYVEYAHRGNLLEELCLTFSHLTCQLEAGEVAEIADTVNFYVDSIREAFRSVLSRVQPEHIACKMSLEAAAHIRSKLAPTNESEDSVCQLLMLLHDVFMWET